jgi:hypothetical protein
MAVVARVRRPIRQKPAPGALPGGKAGRVRYNPVGIRSAVELLMNQSTTTRVARVATLEGFAERAVATEGLRLGDLEPMDVVVVRTRNSVYRLIVTGGNDVTVQGGEFFTDPTPACVDGSGFGGSLIKAGWLGIGLRMEIRAGGRRIITSPVRSITRQDREQRFH